jgi:hypothetical protein
MVDFSGRPVDREKNRPTFLVVAEDPSSGELAFYATNDLAEGSACIDIRGQRLTKAKANALIKTPKAPVAEINVKIPWHRIIRIENVIFQK